ncbi:hypothetical protein BH09PAT2_BH09PAT2_06130 [soil metagenome]
MKFTLNSIISLAMVALVIVNIGIFVKGVGLSDEINYYERELTQLKQQNVEYEYKIYALESISKTASIAAQLDYGTFNAPVYAEKPQYAYNK